MSLFNAGDEQLERRANVGRWEIVRVTFTDAGTDTIVRHRLPTPDPEQITYQLLNATGPTMIYHDGSASRVKWGIGFCRLQSSTADVTADILLTVTAAPVGTTRLPQGAGVTPGLDADTLDGLDSTDFSRFAFKTIAVATEPNVEADAPDDTLTLIAGTGMDIQTDGTTDEIEFNCTVPEITALDDIPDVNAPAPSDGDVLTWDSSPGEWVASPSAGGASALDDLTDVNAPTPADGDVLTFDTGSGDWINAAPTGGGGGSAGALHFLEEHIASSSASLDFTSWYSSDYDEYVIDFVSILPATNTANFVMRMSTNGGSSYDSGSNYTGYQAYAYQGGVGANNTTGTSGLLFGAMSNSATHGGGGGSVRLMNPASTAGYKQVSGWGFNGGDTNVGSLPVGVNMQVKYTSTSAVNAFQFLMSSGNIASGVVRVYGVAKTNSGAGFDLDDLGDVTAPTPSDGDVLTFDSGSGEWVNAAPASGISALDDIPDVDAPTPSDGDVLTFDSGSGDWINAAPAGSGTSPIAPDAISGLQMWLEADAIVGLVDGDPVVTWEDSHTSNNDMTQATGANQPIYKTGILNGLPIVRFDNSNDGMVSVTSLSMAAPYSIFYVANYTGSGTGHRVIASATNNWLLGPYSGAWNMFTGGAFAASVGPAGTNFVVHGCVQQSSPSVATHFLAQLNSSALVFPESLGTITQASNSPATTLAGVRLGASNAYGEPHGGDVAEVIIYNTAVSAADGAGLIQYLIDKYGT